MNSWRNEQGFPAEKFVAMFAGTIGLVSGAHVLVDVAEILRDRQMSNILIVVIGEGVLKSQMIEQARKRNLGNIVFFPFQPTERLSEVQSSADVMLLPMEENHAFSSVPSKLVTYMAVGRPVLCSANGDSTVSRTILMADCGKVVSAGEPKEIAETLIEMSFSRTQCEQMGAKARAFFYKHFDISVAMRNFESLFSRFSQTA